MGLASDLIGRNKLYNQSTQIMLAKYKDVLGIVFDNVTQSKMNIRWIALDFHAHNTLLLNIMGMGKHNIGDMVVNESGETMYIDETNVDNYITQMRFVLPLEAVDKGDSNGIIQFLREYSHLAETITQEALEFAVSDIVFLKENFTIFANSLKDVKSPSKITYDGFDLAGHGLDDLQIQQLRILRPEGKV